MSVPKLFIAGVEIALQNYPVRQSYGLLSGAFLQDAMSEYLNTRSGERAVLNIIQRNPGAVKD